MGQKVVVEVISDLNIHLKEVILFWPNLLKRLAQAKIFQKSAILFWLLNMTIWCKHVHRLELQTFFNFCATHSPARLDIETKFLISNYWQPCQKLEIRKFTKRVNIKKGEMILDFSQCVKNVLIDGGRNMQHAYDI